ncbi:MAG TPA: iron ABC transporter permease [Alphaproteobacteria bacterium]|nr:iron ABC transporter permease [Alphaproteobacteria bacterium]
MRLASINEPGAGGLPVIRAAAMKLRPDPWRAGAVLVAAIVAMPVISLLWLALNPERNIWPLLANTMLPQMVLTTLWLIAGVGAGAILLGVGTAWLVSQRKFPARGFFEWALLTPFAMPAYLTAYAYVDFLEFSGPVQIALRALTGWAGPADYRFPEIRSIGGAILVLSLTLYPYVYLSARAAFLQQASGVLEVSRTLGHGPWAVFFRVALPMARPAIVVGVILALMEALGDFGTVDYFAVRTLTAGVYDVWLGMGNAGGAAQIALTLMGFVLLLITLERMARRDRRFHGAAVSHRATPQTRMSRPWMMAAFLFCLLPVIFGFVIPAGILTRMAMTRLSLNIDSAFLGYALNSLMLASMASVLAVCIGLFLAYGARLSAGRGQKILTRLASAGYVIPGAVLALGVMIPFGAFDNALDALLKSWFGISTGLLLSGSLFALLFAYVVRFLALSFGPLESGLTRITPAMDMASRSLGQGPGGTLWRVHLPLLRAPILTAMLLVFVDCMKELPATLILRPFNFDTLATHVYTYASLGRLEDSALAGLSIVAAGLLPVILLARAITGRPAQSPPG